MNWNRLLVKLGVAFAFLKTLVAYLDPGSGSLIVQILIAMLVGIAATFRLWKTRLFSLFGMKHKPNDEDEDDLDAGDVSQA